MFDVLRKMKYMIPDLDGKVDLVVDLVVVVVVDLVVVNTTKE